MKNGFLFRASVFLTVVAGFCLPAQSQEDSDIQCVLDAINQAEQGVFSRAECTVFNHRFIVEYNDPILHASVRGPVVNTARSFNIPRTPIPPNFKIAGAAATQQDGKQEAIAWIISIYEQITSGLSLSAIAPSTNAALNSTVRTFGAVVMPKVNPQAHVEEEAQTTGAQLGEKTRKGRRGSKPGEISADVEYETFAFIGNDGNTLSLRGAFERTTDAGGLGYGLRLAYSHVTFDQNDNKMQTGEATAFLKIPLGEIIDIGGHITGTVSRIKTTSTISPDGLDQNVNSLGYGPFASVHVNFAGGHMLAGGVMYQIIDPHEKLDPEKENMRVLAYGAMAVLSVSEKLALSAEGFSMKNLEIESSDDRFTIVHPQLHFYLSDSFGLIFGYKTILGIDDYDSNEFTLGSSVRF